MEEQQFNTLVQQIEDVKSEITEKLDNIITSLGNIEEKINND